MTPPPALPAKLEHFIGGTLVPSADGATFEVADPVTNQPVSVSGLGSPEGHDALSAGFARLGRRFDEVRRIVLSHGHVDHYGAARFVQERHGGTIPVHAHEADIPKMAEAGWRWRDLDGARNPISTYIAECGFGTGAVDMLACRSVRDECHSTFTNPPHRKAWELVDAAGCRGLTIGGAQVSEKHCNFLINTGAATAADLEALGEEVRRRVKAQSGVELHWEIKRIGVPGDSPLRVKTESEA